MSIDRQLFAWLAEEDPRKHERAFARYYAEAFPAVVRFLRRKTTRDEADLQEVAQEALLRFFQRIGLERRKAFTRVAEAVAGLVPLPLGAFHEGSVRSWTRDVTWFRREALIVQVPSENETESSCAKQRRDELAARISPLQRRGCLLVKDVETRTLPADWLPGAATSPNAVADDDTLRADLAHIEALLERLRDEAVTDSAGVREAVGRYPGLLPFLTNAGTATCLLPMLRPPSNAYLYDVAWSVLMDTFKRESAKKRGGESRAFTATGDRTAEACSALDALYSGDALEAPDSAAFDESGQAVETVSFDAQIEHADLLERFLEWLHAPVAQAAAAFESAAARGKATAERRKLESLTRKFERLMNVLSLQAQGFTQEEIAERLGISRNQVKYVIESVQEAYARFTAGERRASATSTKDTTHV